MLQPTIKLYDVGLDNINGRYIEKGADYFRNGWELVRYTREIWKETKEKVFCFLQSWKLQSTGDSRQSFKHSKRAIFN